jgi:hypothetical protein
MAKDLKSLVSQLANFGKAASIDQSVTDPAEKGQASTDVPKDRLIAPLAGQAASTETTPAISASEPAGEAKVEHGESTGKVTPAQDYVEPATVAGAKSAASLIEGAASLRSKLANFGKTEVAAPAAPAPAETKEASYVPGNHLLKVAAHLMSSAAGIDLVNRALTEIQGEQEARNMVKAAADEYYSSARAYTEQRLAQADIEEAQIKYAHAVQHQVNVFSELTKEASEQDFADIDNSAALLKRAGEIFEDNEVAYACHTLGLQAAQKVAAAMDQGMPPEMAAQMAGEENMGGEGAPSLEEIEAALEALVSQGIISEEEAMQIAAELMGGASAEGGMPPEGGGEMPKEASAAVAADQALEQVAALIFSH